MRRAMLAPPIDPVQPAPMALRSWRALAHAAVLVMLLSGGAESAEPGEAASGGAEKTQPTSNPPPYQAATDVHQMMALIIDPAADVIWDSAGTIITAEGSKELAPTTDKGWNKVLRASAILTEAGNLLMMPGRAAGDDWVRYSRQLIDSGKLAMQAAQARDADALFDAGGQVYQVCRGCHEQYWVQPGQP